MKDVSPKEFIEAFAKHLKKGNKIKMPEVSAFPIVLFINYIIVGCLR